MPKPNGDIALKNPFPHNISIAGRWKLTDGWKIKPAAIALNLIMGDTRKVTFNLKVEASGISPAPGFNGIVYVDRGAGSREQILSAITVLSEQLSLDKI